MMVGKGPYRADHVGSLLRPASLLDLRVKHSRGEVTDGELKAAEIQVGQIVC